MPKVAAAAAAKTSPAAAAPAPPAAAAPASPAAAAPASPAAAVPAPIKRLVYKPPCGPNPQGGFVLNSKARLSGGLLLSHEWSVAQLSHGRCFLIATLQFKHHAFDVLVVSMRLQELQTLLRVAPSQNLDRFLARPPSVHVTLVRHVEINCIPTRERPAVIFNPINLSGR